MKTIPNKRTTIDIGGELLTYSDLMKAAMMRHRSPEGFSSEEMRKDFRVLDVLDPKAETITLEDADFEHFKSLLKVARWNVVHKDIIAFEDDINAL